MIAITIILLILINFYGFLYSLLITKYNFSNSFKIQSKNIEYKVLKKRLPLILFNVSVLIFFNYIGIRFFDYVFLKDYNSIIVCFIDVVFSISEGNLTLFSLSIQNFEQTLPIIYI